MATHTFFGTGTDNLIGNVCKLLKKKAGQINIERFNNSECKVTIRQNVKGDTCLVIKSLSNPTDSNIIELLFACDALRRSEASNIIGFIPYLGYARQDRQHKDGECVSINVVARILETAGFDKIYTINIHSESSAGVFDIPFKNIDATPFLAKKTYDFLKKNKVVKNPSDIVIVAPDYGALVQARVFAQTIDNKNTPSIAIIDKRRTSDSTKVESYGFYGDVAGKIAVIVDDIIASGGTIIQSSDLCVKNGARQVYASIVHSDLTDTTITSLEKSDIINLFTTDTISPRHKSDKITRFSIADLIAKEIKDYY